MAAPQLGQSISQQRFYSYSRDSLSTPCVSRPIHSHVSTTTSEIDLSRKNRKKERAKLKLGEQPLLGSWSRTGTRESNANTIGTTASTNHLTTGGGPCGGGGNSGVISAGGNNCNGAEK